jgi:hypothetical protein
MTGFWVLVISFKRIIANSNQSQEMAVAAMTARLVSSNHIYPRKLQCANYSFSLADPGLPPYTPPDDGGSDGGGGGGGGTSTGAIVYINPTIWGEATPTATCEAPCTLVLPPWTLSSPTTIVFPLVTETITETWPETTNGVIQYITSTIVVIITIPPLTTSLIDVSNIIITSSTSTVVAITSSILVPPIILTESDHGITWTYSPGPYPTGINGPPPGPPPGLPPFLHITMGVPGPICVIGCGGICLINCGGGGGGGGGGGDCIGPGCDSGDCVGDGCDNDDTSSQTTSTSTCSVQTVTDYWVSCSSSSCTSKSRHRSSQAKK